MPSDFDEICLSCIPPIVAQLSNPEWAVGTRVPAKEGSSKLLIGLCLDQGCLCHGSFVKSILEGGISLKVSGVDVITKQLTSNSRLFAEDPLSGRKAGHSRLSIQLRQDVGDCLLDTLST